MSSGIWLFFLMQSCEWVTTAIGGIVLWLISFGWSALSFLISSKLKGKDAAKPVVVQRYNNRRFMGFTKRLLERNLPHLKLRPLRKRSQLRPHPHRSRKHHPRFIHLRNRSQRPSKAGLIPKPVYSVIPWKSTVCVNPLVLSHQWKRQIIIRSK